MIVSLKEGECLLPLTPQLVQCFPNNKNAQDAALVEKGVLGICYSFNNRPTAMAGVVTLVVEGKTQAILFAYLGESFKKRTILGLKCLAIILDEAATLGIDKLHCSAHKHIKGSRRLIEWLGGRKTDLICPEGDVYILEISKVRGRLWH